MKDLLDTNVLLHLANRATGFRRIVEQVGLCESFMERLLEQAVRGVVPSRSTEY